MFSQSLDGEWRMRQAGAEDWLSARVPGCVHTDLLAAGRIPDPAANDNVAVCSWVAESDWFYQRTFIADDELLSHGKVFLECDGLDTLAIIRLNGEEIGRTENMHRRYTFDVTDKLRQGENAIEVEFGSPVSYALWKIAQDQGLVVTPSDSIPGSPFVRKAMYQWGWDWAPRLPTLGIWRSIRLVGYDLAKIEDVQVRQVHDDRGVTLDIRTAVERFSADELSVRVTITSPGGDREWMSADLGPEDTEASFGFLIEYPDLWWPNGYGDHPLYTVEVEVQGQESEDPPFRIPQSAFSTRIGLRSLELRQEADEWGRSFVFVVNGVPIFCKGANWIPADHFPSQITDEQYRDLIQSAKEANMNMLRIWGGGIYEDERFYDLCDECGILLWHDFMFAGAHYPMDPEMLENIEAEVVDNIRRIRHRPCLALWCGNNEMEWFLARGWSSEGDEDRKRENSELFYRFIPELVAEHDPDTPYWPSSPSSGIPFVDPNGENEGDGHYWEVWHGRASFAAYRMHFFRFMSEFGFQSLPSMPTVRSFAEPEDWNITSFVMEAHQKSYIGNRQILYDMLEVFRLPEGFPNLVYVSQVLQAEAIRYGVEHWRRHRNENRCMGTLYWQLNDCWPVASWSSMEYNHHWKALHYYARRFYSPVLLSAEEADGVAHLHVTNDRMEPFRGEARWSLEKLDGSRLQAGTIPVDVPPSMSTCIADLELATHLSYQTERQVILVFELWQDDRRISMQAVSLVPTKHLELPEVEITSNVSEDEEGIAVTLTADKLARFVMLESPEHDLRFSDNFFDLPAGRTITVRVTRACGLTADEIRKHLKIMSLRDSY